MKTKRTKCSGKIGLRLGIIQFISMVGYQISMVCLASLPPPVFSDKQTEETRTPNANVLVTTSRLFKASFYQFL
jgi:hypothetical protein